MCKSLTLASGGVDDLIPFPRYIHAVNTSCSEGLIPFPSFDSVWLNSGCWKTNIVKTRITYRGTYCPVGVSIFGLHLRLHL
ncbi:hypothetical protein SASPL_126881 [Salvia splendens]|uniref:Uncharacterized protein n=1 Tax=Salvia splendens TaxID=180675 RepID=A0A8X8ZRE5_SALSN|nr:hypothetical protein SASPL_126881 [Salvia splendens]